jgi:hypothetical protein
MARILKALICYKINNITLNLIYTTKLYSLTYVSPVVKKKECPLCAMHKNFISKLSKNA